MNTELLNNFNKKDWKRYCEARVFKRNVWVYSILAEERIDSGSSHVCKGCNY